MLTRRLPLYNLFLSLKMDFCRRVFSRRISFLPYTPKIHIFRLRRLPSLSITFLLPFSLDGSPTTHLPKMVEK
ncbi:hypothetical protein WG66_014486 [Moniliophthora roreri]|nr:hypothetical protein WG66_014486 [Moniliophthora roreri]